MPKRLTVAVVAVVVLALAGTAVAQTAQRFPDVPPEHEAYEAVEWAAETGLTLGYDDGTFRPDVPLSKRHALVFMERYYDDILQAADSEGFTRGDMMVLLKAINDSADAGPADTAAPVGRDAVVLTGRGPGTTEKVRLTAGVVDVVYRATGGADRPFEVVSRGWYTSYKSGAMRHKTRDHRIRELWTDDPAEWRKTYAVGNDASHAPSIYRLSEETVFEVEAEPDVRWSITITPRPLPSEPVVEPDRIVLSSAAGEGPYGPFEFAEGFWRWEFFAWNTSRSSSVQLSGPAGHGVTTLMRSGDSNAVSFGRDGGMFTLRDTLAGSRWQKAGPKYVVVGSRGGWLLTLTRDDHTR